MAAAIIQTIGWVFLPALLWPLIHLALGENTYVKGVSEAVIRVIDGGIFALGEATKWLLPLMVLSVAGSVFALSIFGVTTTKLLESGIYLQTGTESSYENSGAIVLEMKSDDDQLENKSPKTLLETDYDTTLAAFNNKFAVAEV